MGCEKYKRVKWTLRPGFSELMNVLLIRPWMLYYVNDATYA